MSTYLVVRDDTKTIQTPTITGITGTRALNEATPVHMIGMVKRVRAFEEADFILQRIAKHAGQYQNAGPQLGYKYHHPRIERMAV